HCSVAVRRHCNQGNLQKKAFNQELADSAKGVWVVQHCPTASWRNSLPSTSLWGPQQSKS
ncbi:hypothetical protein STEG23_007698, partial [Scotinomys teguina]